MVIDDELMAHRFSRYETSSIRRGATREKKVDNSRLPNTLIIGVQKAATTWLARRLSQHPEVYMVPHEVHYFDRNENYSKGLYWYQSHFRGARKESVFCEKTGAYFWTTCEGVPGEPLDKPRRIQKILPYAKLILILRDPVARAISGWNHNVRCGAIPPFYDINRLLTPDYEELVCKHGILTRGLYYRQLSDYLEHFPRDQIMVLFHETDVKQGPELALRKVCRFLNIDDDQRFDMIRHPENRVTRTRIGVWGGYLTKGLARRVWLNVDKRILARLPLKKWPYACPRPEVIAKLRAYFEDDCERLAHLIGPVPQEWKVGRYGDGSLEKMPWFFRS